MASSLFCATFLGAVCIAVGSYRAKLGTANLILLFAVVGSIGALQLWLELPETKFLDVDHEDDAVFSSSSSTTTTTSSSSTTSTSTSSSTGTVDSALTTNVTPAAPPFDSTKLLRRVLAVVNATCLLTAVGFGCLEMVSPDAISHSLFASDFRVDAKGKLTAR
jgi:hypothetical protein